MKKQFFYRSPGINDGGRGDDEQSVDETSTDSGEETGSEDGTIEDTASGEETSSEDGATDEDTSSGDETGPEDGATNEDTTSGEETSSEDGATDEDTTSGEETGSEDGATNEDTTSGEETGSQDGATDEDTTSGEEIGSEDGTIDEGASSGEENGTEDGATDETNTEEQGSETEDNSAEEGTNTEGQESETEDNNIEEGNNNEGQESETEESNTEDGTNITGEETGTTDETATEGRESEGEENSAEKGANSQSQETDNEENTTGEPEHEGHEVENETVHTQGQASGNEETNTVNTPPVAVVWPGNLSQSPVASPGDELAAFITAIKTNRADVPEHLTDKNKVKNGYMYDPFLGKPQPQPASIQPETVDAWIWEELRSEGSYTSINTYDNMVVTWGRGVAGANIAKVLKSVFSTHSDIQTEFNNVGIGLNTNGILQVIDTTQNCVKEAGFALQAIKADKKLLDFLVDISLNDKYKEVFLDAQWNFVKTFNASLFAYVNVNKWSKDAVQLMFHFNWWLPAYAWNGHPQTYKDTGGDVHKIIYIFAGNLNKNAVLVGYLKKFAGNAFSKYVAKPAYEIQPTGEHIVFDDGGSKYYFPKL